MLLHHVVNVGLKSTEMPLLQVQPTKALAKKKIFSIGEMLTKEKIRSKTKKFNGQLRFSVFLFFVFNFLFCLDLR